MADMKCCVGIYEYKINNGSFEKVIEAIIHTDVNTSAKELFDHFTKGNMEIPNKFYIMQVESIVEKPFQDTINFYTIRVNIKGDIEEISIVSPNALNKDILIDAIIGCTPTEHFAITCTDNVIRKCIELRDSKFVWRADTKQRLQKVNVLRLKEFYQKLKS